MKDKQEEHILEQDDSSHWYVIPLSKKTEWEDWLGDEDNCDVPEWAKEVNGHPNRVIFSSYRMENDE